MSVNSIEEYLALSLEDQLKVAMSKIPMSQDWNMELLETAKGYVKLLIPFQSKFIGNFISGYWHGGMLSAVCDAAGGFAAAAQLYPQMSMGALSTIDLRIDYLKAVQGKDIIVQAKVINSGKRSLFIDMEITYADDTELLTIGRGVFNLRNNSKNDK